ncbi:MULTISPECIES: serine/threonine-protein kinase [unclassified Nodularia (in: cyanobacteria)]|uniref:serine/threonine-protein kinase n=1 Tax=unclassified Nodularia (in: cyanobacteria) TaxID=2656917 RepID=UPI00187F445E|nr:MULTISPECIES: serine/threonine-protein kinase [unclassified Nodularia (in: cyanobacteria)]MBE9201537.1 tetratricopeptide repeat protein [Nodularia sp. LEGE 06071]MCC2694394.1 tetratricopeptide repeat protein [Nodularia sp. LEGE 04288]
MNGQILDARYQILSVLNVEEVVQTYLVEDAILPGSQLVVKQLHPGSDNLQDLTIRRELFTDEAKKLQQLGESHEQIQKLVNYFEDNAEFYLVQEYIIGNNLTAELFRGTPLQEEQVITVLSEVLEILVFVHSRGIIHQDIKPANIIRRESDKKLVLVDFGAVQEVVTTIVGNLEYVPVEQLRGDPQYNSDIYALGIVAIAALIGLPANEISRLQNQKSLLTGEIIWRTKNIKISKQLTKIIDKMVRFDYRHRYQSVTEVLKDIQQVKSHQYTPQKQPQLKFWLILAGIATFFGIVTTTWLFQSTRNVNDVNFQQLYQEGLKKYQAGNYEAAIEDFTQVIALDSENALAYNKRGNAYYQLGDYQQAKIDTSKAIELNPQNAGAYYDRGFAFYELGKYKEAISDYTKAIELNPRNAYAYHGRGLALVQMQENKEASEDFSTAIRLQPDYIEAYLQRGILRRRLKIYHTAIQDFDAIININAADARPYYQKGLIHASNNQNYAAIREYTEAINRNANYTLAYLQRGDIKSELGYRLEAAEDYNTVLKLNPQWGAGYNHRGIHRFSFGDYKGAIEDHSQAISLNSQDAAAYNNRGNANSQLWHLKAANEDYTQAIAINPKYALAYYNRGVTRAKQKNRQGAIADFQQAIKLFRENGERNSLKDAQRELNLLLNR